MGVASQQPLTRPVSYTLLAPEPTNTECVSAYETVLESIYQDAPEYDRFFSNMAEGYRIARFTNTDDSCDLPEITGVSAQPFSDWASSFTSWQSDHVREFREVWSACSEDPVMQLPVDIPVGLNHCSDLRAAITGGGSSGGGNGNDNNSDDNEDEDDHSDNSGSDGGSDGDNADDNDERDGSSRERSSLVAVGAVAAAVLAGLYYI
jgi:hypothetical protein